MSLGTILDTPYGENLLATFNEANNFKVKLKLSPKIQNMKYFRAISTQKCVVKCGFLNPIPNLSIDQFGSINQFDFVNEVCTSDNTWYQFSANQISTEEIEIINSFNFETVSILFQFISDKINLIRFNKINNYVSNMNDNFTIKITQSIDVKNRVYLNSVYNYLPHIRSYRYMKIDCSRTIRISCSWVKRNGFATYELDSGYFDDYSQNVICGDPNLVYCCNEGDISNDYIEIDPSYSLEEISFILIFKFYDQLPEIFNRKSVDGSSFPESLSSLSYLMIQRPLDATNSAILNYDVYESAIKSYYSYPRYFTDAFFFYKGQRIFLSKLDKNTSYFNLLSGWQDYGSSYYQLFFIHTYAPNDLYMTDSSNSFITLNLIVIPKNWITKGVVFTTNSSNKVRSVDNQNVNLFSIGNILINKINPKIAFEAYSTPVPCTVLQDNTVYGPKTDFDTVLLDNGQNEVFIKKPLYYNQLIFYLTNDKPINLFIDNFSKTAKEVYLKNSDYFFNIQPVLYFIVNLIRGCNSSYQSDNSNFNGRGFYLSNECKILNILGSISPVIGNNSLSFINNSKGQFIFSLIQQKDLIKCTLMSNGEPVPDVNGKYFVYFKITSSSYQRFFTINYSDLDIETDIYDSLFDYGTNFTYTASNGNYALTTNYALIWNKLPSFLYTLFPKGYFPIFDSETPYRTNTTNLKNKAICGNLQNNLDFYDYANVANGNGKVDTSMLGTPAYGISNVKIGQFDKFYLDMPINSLYLKNQEKFNIYQDSDNSSLIPNQNISKGNYNQIYDNNNFSSYIQMYESSFDFNNYLNIENLVSFHIKLDLSDIFISKYTTYEDGAITWFRSSLINLNGYLNSSLSDYRFATILPSDCLRDNDGKAPYFVLGSDLVYTRRQNIQPLFVCNETYSSSIWGRVSNLRNFSIYGNIPLDFLDSITILLSK